MSQLLKSNSQRSRSAHKWILNLFDVCAQIFLRLIYLHRNVTFYSIFIHQIKEFIWDFYRFHSLSMLWRRPPRLCGSALRSRWWWGPPHRSFLGRCRSSPGFYKISWRKRPFPSDPAWSQLLWCCRRIRGRRRTRRQRLRYSGGG